jgi:putative transposase
MCVSDVTATLDQALAASGLDHVRPRPRLLSDNGSSYVADNLATWLKGKDMQHVRGAPYHPQTQGKIERLTSTICDIVASSLNLEVTYGSHGYARASKPLFSSRV